MCNYQNMLGRLIARKRESLGMSQKDLANKLGYSSPQFISSIERGTSPLPRSRVGQVSGVLGIEEKIIVKARICRYYPDACVGKEWE